VEIYLNIYLLLSLSEIILDRNIEYLDVKKKMRKIVSDRKLSFVENGNSVKG